MGKLKPISLGKYLFRLPIRKTGVEHCAVCDGTGFVPKTFELVCYDLKTFDTKNIEVELKVCSKCKVPQMDECDYKELQKKMRPYHIETMRGYKQPHYVLRMCQDGVATQQFLKARQRNAKSVQAVHRPKDVIFVDHKDLVKKQKHPKKKWQPTVEQKEITVADIPRLAEPIDAHGKSLFIYKHLCHCPSCLHRLGYKSIVACTAIVETARKGSVKMDVQYCTECKKFMMDYFSFQKYEKQFGPILSERRYSSEFPLDNIEYKADTILSRCGYNAQSDSTATSRQAVLRYILDNGLASKYELKEILARFIQQRGYRCYMAVDKWKADLEYLNQYGIDKQPIVHGLTIKGEQR